MEVIFGLMNIDKVTEIFFTLTSAFFSTETLIILYILTLIGGILFSFEYFLTQYYRQFIKGTSRVMVDTELQIPVEVTIEGHREVVSVDKIDELAEKPKVDNGNIFIDEIDGFIKFITFLQILITVPFSLIYVPLIRGVLKRKITTSSLDKEIQRWLQLYTVSNKITSLLKYVWTGVFFFLTLVVIVGLAILMVIGGVVYFLGG